MPSSQRRSARDERPWNPIVGLLVVIAVLVAAIAAVVFFNTQNDAPDTQTNATQQVMDVNATGGNDTNATNAENGTDAQNGTDAKDKDAKSGSSNETSSKDTNTAPTGNAANTEKKDNGDKSSTGSNGNAQGSTQGGTSGGSNASGSDASGSSSTGGSGSSSDGSSGYAASSDGWISGQACATCVAESGTITASGIPFDDSTPQIGLDTSMDPFSHFGDYVEVTYKGVSVTAQVVDYAGYQGGPGCIIINPAVYEQFGATSPDDWGRRMVEYRFL